MVMSKIIECSECGKEFKTTSYNQLQCSQKCGRERKQRLRREQSRIKKIDDKFKSYCSECEKRIVSYTNVFTCSKQCRHKRKLRLQRENRKSKPRKLSICKECHCIITEAKRKNVCSDKCARNRKIRLQKDNYERVIHVDPIPDFEDFPFDIPEDSLWMAKRNITIAREWVKHPTGRWRVILEEMASDVRNTVRVQEERRRVHKQLNNRKYEYA